MVTDHTPLQWICQQHEDHADWTKDSIPTTVPSLFHGHQIICNVRMTTINVLVNVFPSLTEAGRGENHYCIMRWTSDLSPPILSSWFSCSSLA